MSDGIYTLLDALGKRSVDAAILKVLADTNASDFNRLVFLIPKLGNGESV